MRKFSRLFFGCILVVSISQAQQATKSALYNFVTQKNISSFNKPALFKEIAPSLSDKTGGIVSDKIILSLNKLATLQTFKNRPPAISISIPAGSKTWVLQLVQQDINTSGNFTFGIIGANAARHKSDTCQGLHYRGYINGDDCSFACFSIFANGQVMGIFCNRTGNFTIGKLNNKSGNYILYNSRNVLVQMPFTCGSPNSPPPVKTKNNATQKVADNQGAPGILCKKIRVYWEADYKLYHNNFGNDMVATQNYLAGIFNQVAAMYQNEGVLVELANSYVWTDPDGYTTASSTSGLDNFQARWNNLDNSFDGDVAMLIDGSPTNNGGLAYVLTDNLCNRNYAYGYCNVWANYNIVPTYTWDVFVLTHETGHLLGAHHTHWCGWNTGPDGTCGAIDDCYTVEPSYDCATCGATNDINKSLPGFSGTVMSYCYLQPAIGVDLANGFGPLPRAAIRNTVSEANCAISTNSWTGNIDSAWENAGNWSCGVLPDANTDVTIGSGLTNYPVVNSDAVCKSICQATGSSLKIQNGSTLFIAGLPSR